MLAGFSEGNIDNFAGGFAAATITILYGYYMGAIAEAFMTKSLTEIFPLSIFSFN